MALDEMSARSLPVDEAPGCRGGVTASPAAPDGAAARAPRPGLLRASVATPQHRLSGVLCRALPWAARRDVLRLRVSVGLVLVLGVLAAGFLLRSYIVFHDCAHGSFLPSKRANIWLGSALGVILYTPFQRWRHGHAIHHATAADLDRRGEGDVLTLTVAEYNARDFIGRLRYRLFRNPLVMFGLGPLFAMVLMPRLAPRDARPRIRRSVHSTNASLAGVIACACVFIGWRDFLIIQGPATMLAGSVGIWLFYVQHQFEDTFWERNRDWTYADAALQGSSYLKLPQLLQFFTGNIGLHHVHHLNARIPNYNLQAAHDDNPMLHSVPTLSLWDGLCAVRLKLWDEDSRKLVTFGQARAAGAARLPSCRG